MRLPMSFAAETHIEDSEPDMRARTRRQDSAAPKGCRTAQPGSRIAGMLTDDLHTIIHPYSNTPAQVGRLMLDTKNKVCSLAQQNRS